MYNCLLNTFSLRRKYEFHNHLQHVLCNVITDFHLEKHYHYCYTGLYTLGPSGISLAFDINRKDSQDLVFNSVLKDFARLRA